MVISKVEELFAAQLKACDYAAPEREYRFHPPRRWRFDFAWPALRLAVEVEGGTFSGGRHTRGKGFQRDCEKHNRATLDGWRVLRVTSDDVRSGRALDLVDEALEPVPVIRRSRTASEAQQRAVCEVMRAAKDEVG